MGKIWRLLLLALVLNAALSTAVLARSVYLTDGGIIAAQKVWQEEGRVYVLLNRDSLITFSPEEINLKKTFAKKRAHAAPQAVARSVKVPAIAVPAAPPAKTAPTTSAPPAPVKVAPAAKAGTPPLAKVVPPAPAPVPVAKQPAPRPRPVEAPVPPEKGLEMLGIAFLGAGLLFLLILIASLWKVFTKAGEAGWKSLIPIYNFFVLLRMAGCPSWWLLMFFIPVVNIYFMVVMYIRLAEQFGKPPLFGFALCFLGFIFLPILAFGPAVYGGGEKTFSFDEDEFPE